VGESPGNGPASREHILRLRRYVGHEWLIMVGVAGLVRDEAGQILLIRRSDDGEWCLPAGAMELGERIDRTVEREMTEESGEWYASCRQRGGVRGVLLPTRPFAPAP